MFIRRRLITERNNSESILKTEQRHSNVFQRQSHVFEKAMRYEVRSLPLVFMKDMDDYEFMILVTFPRSIRSNWSGGDKIHSPAPSTSATRTGSCRGFRKVSR